MFRSPEGQQVIRSAVTSSLARMGKGTLEAIPTGLLDGYVSTVSSGLAMGQSLGDSTKSFIKTLPSHTGDLALGAAAGSTAHTTLHGAGILPHGEPHITSAAEAAAHPAEHTASPQPHSEPGAETNTPKVRPNAPTAEHGTPEAQAQVQATVHEATPQVRPNAPAPEASAPKPPTEPTADAAITPVRPSAPNTEPAPEPSPRANLHRINQAQLQTELKPAQARLERAQAAQDYLDNQRYRYERVQGGVDEITRHADGTESRDRIATGDKDGIVRSSNGLK